jgi:small subunit ribosomal protein S2
MADISLADLATHAVHFGHKSTRWNPKMKPFLAGEQNGIHVFDLRKTLERFHKLIQEIEQLAKENRTILFVSTKPQTKELFDEFQKETGYPIVVNKWVGGTLTNFDTIKGRLREMKKMEEMFETGEIEKYTKKERGNIAKELEKLKIAFGGIADMYRMPDAVFIVDGKRDEIAIREANRLGIPVIGFADSNVNPDLYSICVPANDDAVSSLIYLLSFVFEAARVRGDDKKKKHIPEKKESDTPAGSPSAEA